MRDISRRNLLKTGLSAAGLMLTSGPLAFCSKSMAMAERDVTSSTSTIVKLQFEKLFAVFESRIDLFGKDPANPKMPADDLKNHHTMRSYILDGARNMPGVYYEAYVAPLLNGLEPILARNTVGTIETLAGAVYDHRAKSLVLPEIPSFVSLISNVYRSFLVPELIPPSLIAVPSTIIPPLATFRPETDERFRVSFTLHATEVKRLTGGSVAVVSLPSVYRKHPVLCWAAIAHEVGGHDILDTYRGLLVEIQQVVRRQYYEGPDPASGRIETDDQFLGLVWQYWTEESASDVCAVMNVGPAYAYGLIIYLAAINDHYSRNKQGHNRQGLPNLRASTLSIYVLNPDLPVGVHPPDVLKLHVLLGAIDTLPIEDSVKQQYGHQIRHIAAEWCKEKDVVVRGTLQLRPGRLIKVDKTLPRAVMERKAYETGKRIASQTFQALDDHSLQDLETWDKADHYAMTQVRENLLGNMNQDVSYLGDDGQLLSGAIEALCRQPDLYDDVNAQISRALAQSFKSDPIWAQETEWHP